MADSPFIIDVNQDNFEQVVIEGSKNAPVLVDFWADWCNPCQMLMPVLSKLAEEYGGQFVLAKLNSDQNQELSVQYGVRSLPTVKLFKGGEAVDEFMGALPESQVREFLDKHIETETETETDTETDNLRQQAGLASEAGDIAGARALLEQANVIDPGRTDVIVDLALLLADEGKIEDAEALLQALPQDEKTRQPVSGLMARMDFLNQAAQYPASDELRAALENDSADSAQRFQLAIKLIAVGDFSEEMDELLEIIRKDRAYDDDIARKTMLKVFDLLGSASMVNEYRRKMASLLY